jgi:hypothetical protein
MNVLVAGKWLAGLQYKLINEVGPPCLVLCKPLPRSCGRRRVTSVPTIVEPEERDYISEHRGLARGWLVVNPLGVTEPMVGWKQAPLSAVASHYLVLISIFLLYVLN